MTEAEKKLWWHLRHRLAIEHTHFRRQVPLGPYVTDFCCLTKRLIVEVDGGGHTFEAQAAQDARRTVYLESIGYRVIRLTNAEVTCSIDNVLDTILAALFPLSSDEGSRAEVMLSPKGSSAEHKTSHARPIGPKPQNGVSCGSTPTPDPSPQGGGEQEP